MSDPASKAIFLSYARDDAVAARRLAEALRSSGLEVWFDENELRGGDAWDGKIRRQIDECTLFVPVISQRTNARAKGYFRLEWKLAVDQTQLLAAGVPFIAPIAIDDVREAHAVVPPEFMRVQWIRLPGALPTPEFIAQIKRLIDAPRVAPNAATPGLQSNAEGVPVARKRVGRRLPAAAWLGAFAVVAIGIGVVTFSDPKTSLSARGSSNGGPAIPPPATERAAAPVSESRQLVTKARALYEPWNLATANDFALAGRLLKQAIELDSSDGEAWAASAILSCGLYIFGHDDQDDVNKANARTHADNAIKLSPGSDLARFARAFSLRFDPHTREEAIRLLREEAARQPANRFILCILAGALRDAGQIGQALVYLDKAAALPGRDAIVQNLRGEMFSKLKRFAEAEAAFDEALAIAPQLGQAHEGKMDLLLSIHGDLAAAKAHLATLPSALLLVERIAITAYRIELYARNPSRCLDVLRSARPYLGWWGPKASLTARAHRLAGNEEAARSDFRAALRVVDQRLEADPNNSLLALFPRRRSGRTG